MFKFILKSATGAETEVDIDDIIILRSKDKYVTIYSSSSNPILWDGSLNLFIKQTTKAGLFDPFIHIHRAWIVRSLLIESVVKGKTDLSDSLTSVKVKGVKEPIPLSRRNVPIVRRLIKSRNTT